MSPRATTGEAGHGGRVAVTVLIVAIAAVVMLLVVRADPKPGSFDPRSGSADGASALVLLLREQGATVDVIRKAPSPGSGGRVLVLDDRLNAGQRDELLTWVRAGGVAVVADPASPLHGGADLPTSEVRSSLPPWRSTGMSMPRSTSIAATARSARCAGCVACSCATACGSQ